jgi:putative transposase
LNTLYRFLGLTRQAVFDYKKRQLAFDEELEELIAQVETIRRDHPGCGVEKMYGILRPELLGRDKFREIFMGLGYGVRRIRNYHRTTIPTHIRYPNLIEGMIVSRPYEVIQSDITYYELRGKHYYIVFIIDVYTREILGHSTSGTMRVEANVKAMKISLKKMSYTPWCSIHHSDRGAQYASGAYVQLLRDNKIHVSMGLKAQDNAYAERINGTIKNEYLKRWVIKDEKDLVKKVNKAVKHYNEQRKHLAFENKFSPIEFRNTLLNLSIQKRPKVIIYAEGNNKIKAMSSRQEFNPKKEPQHHNCPIGLGNEF